MFSFFFIAGGVIDCFYASESVQCKLGLFLIDDVFEFSGHGPPKVNIWEDPMSPSKWKEEHVSIRICAYTFFLYSFENMFCFLILGLRLFSCLIYG